MVVLSMLFIRSDVLKEQLSAQSLVWFLLATMVPDMGFIDLSRQRVKAESIAVVNMYCSVLYEACA